MNPAETASPVATAAAAPSSPADEPGTSDPIAALGQDAVVTLTRLARVTYPGRDGGVIRVDFADVLAGVLASVAANVDGVEELLAGRPGSWEADLVRRLVAGTVGPDEEYMPLHRTEPIRIDADAEALLDERTNGGWADAWEQAWDRATDHEDTLYEQARSRHAGEDWLAPVVEDVTIFYQPATPEDAAAAREYRDRFETERTRIHQLHPDVAAAHTVVVEVDRARNGAEDTYQAALLAAATAKAQELGYDVPVVHEYGAATWLGEQLLTHALGVTPAPQPPAPDWTLTPATQPAQPTQSADAVNAPEVNR